MSNTTTMTLYATERAIGCRSSMSSSSSNEKFFSPPVDSLSTLSRYTRKTLVHHHHPRRLRARRCTQQSKIIISRARIQNRSREGFFKFKRVRSPSARDREWVGVHRRRRQKVGRASSSSPKWCWLRAKKREKKQRHF